MKSKNLKKTYYHIEFDDEIKREVNPFKLRNFLSDKCIQKVNDLKTDSKNGFSFKGKKNEELNQLSDTKMFKEFSCEIAFSQTFKSN